MSSPLRLPAPHTPCVYIAGPMRGYPEHNAPAFHDAAQRLRRAGFDVVSPVEIGEALGGRNAGWTAEQFVAADLSELMLCDAIALLPNWHLSTGARCEAAVAVTLGLSFLDAMTFDELAPPSLIEIRGGYGTPPELPRSAESLDQLAREIVPWQNTTFPHSTAQSRATHLVKEAKELAEHPTDPEEMADVFFLVVGVAAAAGVDLAMAVRQKLEINKTRTWGTPDVDGIVEHVREVSA